MPESTHNSPTHTRSPVERLLAADLSDPLHPALVLVVRLRLTAGEALTLAWNDVDRRQGRLRLPDRQVPLSPAAMSWLDALAARQRFHGLIRGTPWHGHGPVVATDAGRPFTRHEADTACRRLTEQAGLPPLPLDALRHPALTT